MSNKTVISGVRDYIETCPHLAEFEGVVGVDNLAEDDTAYAVESVPAKEVVTEYLDGSCKKAFTFMFTSRAEFGQETRTTLDNIGFYGKLASWLHTETRAGRLPDLGIGRTALSLEAVTSGYLYDVQGTKAKYQIECTLVYMEREEINYGRDWSSKEQNRSG